MPSITQPHDGFAASVLERVLALDQPIGQLVEIVLAMSERPERAAIKECCGELVRRQFDLIEWITKASPELDKIVEARLPPLNAEVWKKVSR